MPFMVEHIMREPIIVINWQPPFDFEADIIESNRAAADFADHTKGIVYRVIDAHEIDMTFGDLVTLLAAKTRNEPGSLRDPRIHTVLVGTHDLLRLKADSLRQKQYGELDIPLFPTVDEAVDYCRQQLKAAYGL